MERVYIGLTDRAIGIMGSGVDGVRVGRSVGGALELGAVAAGRSKGVRGQKRPTAERASASGTTAKSPLFVVLPASGTTG